MGILLQGFFQQNNKGVPCPNDGDTNTDWWWDHLAKQANALRLSGFSAVWIPPVQKGASGIQSIGYDVFDDYDLGAKDQKWTNPTRYGSRELLQRFAAVLRANGIDIYLDVVNHQRDGGNDFVYMYPGVNGEANTGRFPKNAMDFHPNVPPDPNVTDTSLSFGDDLSPMNCVPSRYVFNALIDSCDWYTRALDLQGYRFDDAKGISTDFTLPLATSKSMAGKFVVGELISPIGDITNWVFNGMQGKASAFDYPLHFLIAGMCNNPGGFDMTQLDDSGFTAEAPFNSVTFVENHDTDGNSSLGTVVTNKMLGYALIMTIEGYPSVYYRDYSTDTNCYGLKSQIDPLIWIHENLASGNTVQRWKDYDVFAYERLGGSHLLTALNNNPGTARTITVATGFGPNVAVHDYTGHAPDVTTDGGGNATITIPANTDGSSYVCYSVTGITADFVAAEKSTTQQYEGAPDLDIAPANQTPATVSRIYVKQGSPISIALQFGIGTTAGVNLTVEILDPNGNSVETATVSSSGPGGVILTTNSILPGWHSLMISTTAAVPVSFILSVTYTATQTI